MPRKDPNTLPAVAGTVERLVPGPKGEAEGLVLTDPAGRSRLVRFPPHLAREVEALVRPGEFVAVRGENEGEAGPIAAAALTAADGRAVVDRGPKAHGKPPKHERPAPQRREDALVAGRVRLTLTAPKGEPHGAILEDGTVVRLGPKEAERFADLLRPGARLAARGPAIGTAHGTVLEAEELGPDPEGPAAGEAAEATARRRRARGTAGLTPTGRLWRSAPWTRRSDRSTSSTSSWPTCGTGSGPTSPSTS